MLFNYAIGTFLTRTAKKSLLTFGIIVNLGALGYFKYMDFFISNINLISTHDIPLLYLTLPLAISSFTFQQIAYLVDSYKGQTQAYSPLHYAMFVTFFPQLIAGPIVHHREMMPQFMDSTNKSLDYNNIAIGLFIFSIGFFKKVAIADSLGQYVDAGFANPGGLSTLESWATSIGYSLQLYFDFSGYADMATGAALLFNIKLPANFNSPYKALDIQDFWKKWHITLGRFFKSYVYIPLGGNRRGDCQTLTNLFCVALISGLWHGAGWTFVVWGALHGGAMVLHRMWSIYFKHNVFKMIRTLTNVDFTHQFSTFKNILAWFTTITFVHLAFVFFRADSIKTANIIIAKMFFLTSVEESKIFASTERVSFIILVVLGCTIALTPRNSLSYLDEYRPRYGYFFVALMCARIVMQFLRIDAPEFLYFNF